MKTKKYKTEYDDIITLTHPVSNIHPQMSLHDRAAQFAPFAALTGHQEAIKETARLTEKKIELSEEEQEKLNQKLLWIICHIKEQPEILITYFIQDQHKTGGKYITKRGKVKKIKETEQELILDDQSIIFWKDIYFMDFVYKNS